MTNEELYKKIISLTSLKDENIFNIYIYGSRVYGTFNKNSDYDLMVVIDDSLSYLNNKELRSYDGLINIHLETLETFKNHILEHKIKELELISLPKEFIIKESFKPQFKLDLAKLREEISSKSNNSWVKAKKKLILNEENDYIGLKSLYHALRIVLFGIQIAKHKKIINFEEKNEYYFDIVNKYQNNYKWDDYKNDYQQIYDTPLPKGSGFLKISLINSIFNQLFFLIYFY